ncbi:MAG: tetraacyldisaccharide 4'-kinase [Alphaproteobacteria bacterium]|nr:tetraacyldisaccharide 4'-kinase [Alphaproteobacteria bacterium]
MRAPAFWWQAERTAAAMALAPAGWLMGRIAARRMAHTGDDLGVPVICAGNFVAGGAGKTPVALACAQLLQAAGKRPVFISRGYGGSASHGAEPLLVDPHVHTSTLAGDEPLLLAAQAPAIVFADRRAAARAALRHGADVIVMDDGLQNPSLRKHFAIAAVDGETGIGNGMCIPAGPLRAPFEEQLAHTHALVIIGQGEAGEKTATRAQAHGVACFRATLQNDPASAERLRGERLVAFAGIGRPEKFFNSLEQAGAILADAYSFSDHQMLDEQDMGKLRARASQLQARLVTTRKDLVRLKARHAMDDVAVLDVTLVFAAERAFAQAMLNAISAAEHS